jgi:hypothetical protein
VGLRLFSAPLHLLVVVAVARARVLPRLMGLMEALAAAVDTPEQVD